MSTAGTLDNQINKAAFWSAIAVLLVTVPSLFLPLDAPDGPFTDRVVWFSSNLGKAPAELAKMAVDLIEGRQ
jgi:hypothetical protein